MAIEGDTKRMQIKAVGKEYTERSVCRSGRTFDNLQTLTSAVGQNRGCLPPKSTYAPVWSTLQAQDKLLVVFCIFNMQQILCRDLIA